MIKRIFTSIKNHIQWPCEKCCSNARFKSPNRVLMCAASKWHCNRGNKFMCFKARADSL